MNGQFVISLDFEKFWGVFDSLNSGNYNENLNNAHVVVDKLLELSNAYNVKLTFATVGFLFNKTKDDFIKNIPNHLPTYTNKLQNPYPIINLIGLNESEDIMHYGYSSIIKIKNDSNHEISTHTYCHYYCLEKGQTIKQFEADLLMSIKVAKDLDLEIKSIVFPRNQVKQEYLKLCSKHGIISYRGVEDHPIYQPKAKKDSKSLMHRALRLSDAYINITGQHTYNLDKLKSKNIINLPSSSFLRPYNKKLRFLEPLRVKRVKRTMEKAAKNKELFHMWFHPHNFGKNIDENFENLEQIYKHYEKLNSTHNLESTTMTSLANKLLIK